MEKVICSMCGKECVPDGIGTGYGSNAKGEKFCYDCCGELDRQELASLDYGEGMSLYLTHGNEERGEDKNAWYAKNWPGTISIRVGTPRKGRHNLAGTRYDVWFDFRGKSYHGVNYGEDSQILHVKRVKAA